MRPRGKQMRTLSLVLVCAFCFNLLPLRAFAAGEGSEPAAGADGICEHHPFHTEECGYVEAVPETPCTHVHTEECWRQETRCIYEEQVQDESEQADSEGETRETEEAAVPSDSTHVCSEETGCVTKVLDCQHQHDAECGYVPEIPSSPCGFVCPDCSQEEDTQTVPYYLLLIHTLDYQDTRYGFSEVIGLMEEELQDGGYDLRQHILEKEGMAVKGISCLNPETDDLEEAEALSQASFSRGGDPENGEGYFAAQVLIEYQALDGYCPVLLGDSDQLEDPYGIMPLTSFEGGNIKDLVFEAAEVLTVRLNYKYSPTGGLAGMDAADSQVIQLNATELIEDETTENVVITKDLPDGTDHPTLEGFRIVLDPAPLNAFVNKPDWAAQAMNGELTAEKIQEYLESDAFSVNTNNADMPVYQWQVNGGNPPEKYEDYPTENDYNNRYSDIYNQAWDKARLITVSDGDGVSYTVQAVSENPQEHQGANPLESPQLKITMTKGQCRKLLDANGELEVTVYYRRNAGFYHVGHWVPQASLSEKDVNTYKSEYSAYNQNGVEPFDDGYLMVYLERKQGRVGALTNARANPPEAESILSSFNPHAVTQETIEADTRVDILYDTADRYGLIFQTEDSYIPRQYVNKGYTVTFKKETGSDSAMQVIDSDRNPVSGYETYKNPTRQGYTFAGWKYEVRDDAAGDGVTEENDRKYRIVNPDSEWEITEKVVDEAVVVRDSDIGDAKMIYLYPVWSPAEANVRVVFWTEDLGGGAKDVKVTVTKDESGGKAEYLQNLKEAYTSSDPGVVGDSFSNVGSFTFMAPTNSKLYLSVEDGAVSTSMENVFTTTVKDTELKDKLNELINKAFPLQMPDAVTSTTPVNTSKFYYPYQVEGKKDEKVEYEVKPDGSTVINVYYARNVYTLDFTYYGDITKESGAGSGTDYNGDAGLVVATNTIGYSVRDKSQITEKFDYDYQSSSSDNLHKNRWQLVDKRDTPQWTVPKTLTISAKYDANLQEVWPVSRGEVIALNMPQSELDKNLKDVAVFMSWGATDGPFNQTYRKGESNESTIIGNYRAMGADIIANPDKPSVVHHLVGYWWNQNQSYYRRNACYEVPGLTSETLLAAVGSGDADVKTFNLNNRTWVYEDDLTPSSESGKFNVVPIDVPTDEKERRDTVYLVPVNGSSLDGYFVDYRSNFIEVDETGEPKEKGGYYAVRRIGLEDDSKVYALGRQAMSVSNNYILAQEPTDMPNMTKVAFTYVCESKTTSPVFVDHDSRTWDDWGRTAPGLEPKCFIALGTVTNPYDIWFYYDRALFTIYYMVASRNSSSGEYEIGRHETIYGQNMKRYNLTLDPEDARLYSNAEKFKSYWEPFVNNNPISDSVEANGLNAEGYTRLSPDSAVDGAGEWKCEYWSLDRSGSGVMEEKDWNRMVTGNLRVFAQWTPPKYKVKFDFDGGSYNGSEKFPIQTVSANVGYTSSGNTIPSPTKDGFVFNGWTWYEGQGEGDDLTAKGQPLNFTFETPITRNMVLKAKWTASATLPYRYKIWYLTDDENTGGVTLPKVEGQWLDSNRGSPEPDDEHKTYTQVLGCQYVEGKALPEGTVLSLAAVAIPGYTPVKISTTLALDAAQNGDGAENTRNVAYFYYRKSQVKSYTVRFQLWDKTGDEGILKQFTTQSFIADSTYFTPGKKTWEELKNAGYYLVQMKADGKAQTDNGEPIAAKTYQELSEFVDSEIQRFESQLKGTNMTVTFKVAPYHYTIQYHVGKVMQGSAAITPSDALRRAMQAVLDSLAGGAVQTAVAKQNPTRYTVADFDDGFSFTLKNPVTVKDPNDSSKQWRFTGWSPAPGTVVVPRSRSVAGEYPTLEIERSKGDLEFLANWVLVDSTPPVTPEKPSDDPEDPPDEPEDPPVDPGKPPVDPKKPPVEPEKPGKPEELPTELPDPNSPDAPETITILEDGVPTTYRKVWNPEAGMWVYILDEDVPLVPNTGDYGVFPWLLLSVLSFAGLAISECLRRFWDAGKEKDEM